MLDNCFGLTGCLVWLDSSCFDYGWFSDVVDFVSLLVVSRCLFWVILVFCFD